MHNYIFEEQNVGLNRCYDNNNYDNVGFDPHLILLTHERGRIGIHYLYFVALCMSK